MGTKVQINSLQAFERLLGNNNEIEIEIRGALVQEFSKRYLKSIATSELMKLSEQAVISFIEDEYFEEKVTKGGWGGVIKRMFFKDKHTDELTFEYKPPKEARYNAVWHDIWNYITAENLPEMKKLTRKYGRKADYQASWCRYECEAAEKRSKNNRFGW